MEGEKKGMMMSGLIDIKKLQPLVKKKDTHIHSELHELIATLRRDFGETAKKGKGSFSFYLGLLKRVPISTIYRWHANIKDSPNLCTPEARRKVFWYLYRQSRTKKIELKNENSRTKT